jgi:hypothetical protein
MCWLHGAITEKSKTVLSAASRIGMGEACSFPQEIPELWMCLFLGDADAEENGARHTHFSF